MYPSITADGAAIQWQRSKFTKDRRIFKFEPLTNKIVFSLAQPHKGSLMHYSDINKKQIKIHSNQGLNLKPITAIILSALAFQAQAADTFTMHGNLGTANNFSYPYAVSGDGITVVGESLDENNSTQAFSWTATNGMLGLGFLGGVGINHHSSAKAVSADGNAVVGVSSDNNGNSQAFRWTDVNGMQGLGFIGAGLSGSSYSYAQAVSADGNSVAGSSTYDVNTTNQQAFLWSSVGGMRGLGFIGTGTINGASSRSYAISSDGSTVVGESSDSLGNTQAFRWSDVNGMQGLGFVGAENYSRALAVSAIPFSNQVLHETAYHTN